MNHRVRSGNQRPSVDTDAWELVLEDGGRFPGTIFGAQRPVAGEVVFATGMTGYVESLTDPSYRGQVLVLTYPLQGNYGVGGPSGFQSSSIQVQGLVVSSATKWPSHHASVRSLSRWLVEEGVCGLQRVDTRALTQHLREHGTLRGWLLPAGLVGEHLGEAKRGAAMTPNRELARRAAIDEPRVHEAGAARVLLVDAGAKESITRELLVRRVSVARVPFYADLRRAIHEHRVHGIVLSNGPGDPKDLTDYVDQVRALLGCGLPLLGICLGCQVLALAAGGDTCKLPYGHRSQNQPVRDLATGRCYMTSQNHGYAVRAESLPPKWSPWFVNLNDGTNEGIRHRELPVAAVQFHPEAAPGPEDTRWIFDGFCAQVDARRLGGVSG